MSQTDTTTIEPQVPAKPAVLQTAGISVRFGGVTALNQVTLDFLADEVCGLIGPNGAGKTTLFDTISGIRNPTEGRVMYDGVDVTGRSVTWRARHGIRRTFQRQQTFGWLSVEDNIMTALEWRGGGGGLAADLVRLPTRLKFEKARRQRVREVLELCGIADIAGVPAASLPLGKARMAEMARAIVDHPRVLLLDEPTSGLDPLMENEFRQIIREEQRREGRTVLLSSHVLSEVEALCDRVTLIRAGRTVETGTLSELRHLTRTVIHAELAGPPTGLADLPGVHNLLVDGNRVSFDADSDALDEALRDLTTVGVRSLISQPPTLEELFLRHYQRAPTAGGGQPAGTPA